MMCCCRWESQSLYEIWRKEGNESVIVCVECLSLYISLNANIYEKNGRQSKEYLIPSCWLHYDFIMHITCYAFCFNHSKYNVNLFKLLNNRNSSPLMRYLVVNGFFNNLEIRRRLISNFKKFEVTEAEVDWRFESFETSLMWAFVATLVVLNFGWIWAISLTFILVAGRIRCLASFPSNKWSFNGVESLENS